MTSQFGFLTIKALAAMLLLAIGSGTASGEIIFRDDFESGDRSRTTNGFRWGNSGDNVVVSNERATSGQRSLSFTFRGKPSGEDSSAQQRFELGGNYTELWIQYNIRIPDNYYHRDDSPSNNKLLVLWSKDYSGGAKWGNNVSFYAWDSSSYPGGSRAAYKTVAKTGHKGYSDGFITAQDRGKWFQWTMHWKRQSGSNTADGVIEMWKAELGKAPQVVFSTKSSNETWGPDHTDWPTYNFLDKGYLMGWANSGYSQDTTFHIDDFVVSTTSLLGGGTSDSPAPPKPPTDVRTSTN